jgi:hypothetical protein
MRITSAAEREARVSDNWTIQAADAIEKTVATVRDRTVEPAQRAAKYVVFGVLAACCVITALFLLAIVGFRVLSYVMPIWAAWMVLGGIFIAGGLFSWTRRTGGSRD